MGIEIAFFSHSLAWREGFIHQMSGAKWSECIDYVDEKYKQEFENGWSRAMEIRQRHNDELNHG